MGNSFKNEITHGLNLVLQEINSEKSSRLCQKKN